MPNSQLTAVLFMVLSMVAYQISASFAKQLFEVLDPLTVVTLRLSFASILIVLMFRSWKIIKRLPYLKWKDLLFYSGSVCLMNVLFYASLGKLPQGIAVGLEFLGPLTLALLSIKQKTDYLWVCLAILGVALMVPWQDTSADNFFLFRSSLRFRCRYLLGDLYLFRATGGTAKYWHACTEYCHCAVCHGDVADQCSA